MISGVDLVQIVMIFGVILLSMTLHEAMHAFMGYWLGDDTAKLQGRLTLNPIKHIDPFLTVALPLLLAITGAPIFGGARPVPFNPDQVRGGEWGAALVAIAGPLTNFILAFIAFGIWVLIGFQFDTLVGQFMALMVSVNLGFFAFNILPIPPLDGSRVLYALAPEFVRRGMEVIEQFGLVVVFVLVIFASTAIGAIMSNIITAIIHVFSMIFGVA